MKNNCENCIHNAVCMHKQAYTKEALEMEKFLSEVNPETGEETKRFSVLTVLCSCKHSLEPLKTPMCCC